MSLTEENIKQVHSTTLLIIHGDCQRMSKFIDDDALCSGYSDSDSSTNGDFSTEADRKEKFLVYIESYTGPERILPPQSVQ